MTKRALRVIPLAAAVSISSALAQAPRTSTAPPDLAGWVSEADLAPAAPAEETPPAEAEA